MTHERDSMFLMKDVKAEDLKFYDETTIKEEEEGEGETSMKVKEVEPLRHQMQS